MSEVSEYFYQYMSSLYGEEAAKEYSCFIEKDPTLYIRTNPLKTDFQRLSLKLKEDYSITSEELPAISGAAKILSGKDVLGKTVEHIMGEYYIQGLSSMIPPLVLSPSPGETVLDLCAAPGSKTTGLAELMRNKGTLVANEIALDRVKMLIYNLDRLNIINTSVVHQKGEWLSKVYGEHFDKILVDAPCSGLGIIQKKEEVKSWWTLERAARLGDLQLRLLIAAVKMLKPGGEVVYSTCTLTPEENEFIVNKVLEKYPVEIIDIDIPVKWREGFTSYNGVSLHPSLSKARRILPWEADSDGFFIVKLKKTGGTESPEFLPPKLRDIKIVDYQKKEIREQLKQISEEFGIPHDVLAGFKYIIKNNDIFFVDNKWNDEHPGMFERIGTRFGLTDKNKYLVLHTQAAQVLQKYISQKIFEIESRDDLKIYLDGGTIKTERGQRGQFAVKYKDSIIGTGVMTESGLKSRFPRAKRTQEILIGE